MPSLLGDGMTQAKSSHYSFYTAKPTLSTHMTATVASSAIAAGLLCYGPGARPSQCLRVAERVDGDDDIGVALPLLFLLLLLFPAVGPY
jgi:hypothetical protein